MRHKFIVTIGNDSKRGCICKLLKIKFDPNFAVSAVYLWKYIMKHKWDLRI